MSADQFLSRSADRLTHGAVVVVAFALVFTVVMVGVVTGAAGAKGEEPSALVPVAATVPVDMYAAMADIAAALAISGIGFDRTTVSLLADPTITKTKHTVDIASKIGTYRFEFINEISQENPKSSQLAAYSVLAELETFARAFGKPNRKTEK